MTSNKKRFKIRPSSLTAENYSNNQQDYTRRSHFSSYKNLQDNTLNTSELNNDELLDHIA